MAPLLLWTAMLAAASAMPMLAEQQADPRGDRLGLIPASILEWYLQQRELQPRDLQWDRDLDPQAQAQLQALPQTQPQIQQFRQWLDSQLARLPAVSDPDETSKALVAPQPKRGNCEYTPLLPLLPLGAWPGPAWPGL